MYFSVLMSVYSGTRSDDLINCLASLVRQTKPAAEIVIVEDGPVNNKIRQCVNDFQDKLPVRSVVFFENRGLGLALRDGLNYCSHELVARVDSDDECVRERFELQTNYLNKHPDICAVGGALREWYNKNSRPVAATRNGPLGPKAVANSAKYRNPLNHQTVMFRKTPIQKCGSYENFQLFEDYHLWMKLLNHGYRLDNLNDVLVETNVNTEYFLRRGGLSYITKELSLAKYFLLAGYFSLFDFLIFVSTRLPIRLIPPKVRLILYQYFLRTNAK